MEKTRVYEFRTLSSEAIKKVNDAFMAESESKETKHYYLSISNGTESVNYDDPNDFFCRLF